MIEIPKTSKFRNFASKLRVKRVRLREIIIKKMEFLEKYLFEG
jgi:hypothetical protein